MPVAPASLEWRLDAGGPNRNGEADMREVIQAAREALGSRGEVLLCQVVETKGSTPQKAGAWMLVDSQGGQVGTLGGGCVEAEVKQKAIRLLGTRACELFDFLLDHDTAWADGLICGGRMRILAQGFAGAEAARYFEEFANLIRRGEGFTEYVVIDDAAAGHDLARGARILVDHEGARVRDLGWTGVVGPVTTQRETSGRAHPSTRNGVAILPNHPRIRLVIVGAGHVGQAVAELAAKTDFEVWVVDDRRQYANRERFPLAARILVGSIDEVLSGLELTARCFALVVTRGHGHDQESLFHLAPTGASYVGLIGSRRKIRMIFEGLRDQGVSEQALERVSAPVGLDIGSESVAEIAVSIVAELIARRNLGPRGAVGNDFTGLPTTQRAEAGAP
jgi:xanthine dehydrogenase accessory factor